MREQLGILHRLLRGDDVAFALSEAKPTLVDMICSNAVQLLTAAQAKRKDVRLPMHW